jgi:hypothetical protein
MYHAKLAKFAKDVLMILLNRPPHRTRRSASRCRRDSQFDWHCGVSTVSINLQLDRISDLFLIKQAA